MLCRLFRSLKDPIICESMPCQSVVVDPKVIERLEKEMFEVIQLGKCWGLSEYQIGQSLDAAFKFNHKKHKHGIVAAIFQKLKYPMKFCFVFGILSLLVFFIVFLLSIFHTSTQMFFRKHFDHISYPALKQLRLWSLPLFKSLNMDFTEWHELECLIKNPLYLNAKLDCWACTHINQIPDLSGFTNFSKEYYHNAVPFIIKDANVKEVSFEILKQLYEGNTVKLLRGTTTFTSHSQYLFNLNHLLDGDAMKISSEADLHIKWIVNRIPASQVIRQLFPRPYFVPQSTEVSLEKIIFIDGHSAVPYKIPVTDFANVWLMQAWGSRHLVLIPSKHCSQECHTMSVELSPKDVCKLFRSLY